MYVAFIDFENNFDRVDKSTLWQLLEESRYPQLLRTTQGLYNGTRIPI